MTQLLKNWLQQGPSSQQLISFNHHDIVTGTLFTSQVAYFYRQLCSHPQQKWLLYSDKSDLFAVALCAALLAGKEVLLPINTQPGSIEDMADSIEGVISDVPITLNQPLEPPYIQLKSGLSLASEPWPKSNILGKLTLFTSGSSGQPKAIEKKVSQLDAEVSLLEQTFARQLPQSSVIATVSHQHIYGLLFRILWPLAAGRPFLSELIEYPETLSYYMALFPNLCLVSSPAQLSHLPSALDHEKQAHSPSLIFSSGGPLGFEAAQDICHCYDQLPIEVFGSTETGGIAYRRQQQLNEPWRPFAKIEVRQDKKHHTLLVKSPYLPSNDWYESSDRIQLLDDGNFIYQGRLDRIVKISEKRLSLSQMESLLEQHPLVKQAALVLLQLQRTQLGAVITLSNNGQQLLAKEGKLHVNNQLKNHLLTHFEKVTLPKRWRYPELLPLNAQGKRVEAQLIELFHHD